MKVHGSETSGLVQEARGRVGHGGCRGEIFFLRPIPPPRVSNDAQTKAFGEWGCEIAMGGPSGEE